MSQGQMKQNYFTQERLKNANMLDGSFLSLDKNMTPEKLKQLLGDQKIAVIALNHPIGERLWPLWQCATLRLTDVGGASHLCDEIRKLNMANQKDIAPSSIVGNVERLGENVCGWAQQGTKIIKSVDETKNDLERILEQLLSMSKGQQKSEIDMVFVYGAFNQRLDKLLGNLNVATKYASQFNRMILMDENNFAEILPPGVHQIKYQGWNKNNPMTCGIFPVAGSSNEVATQGLKWDLNGERLQMGSFVSQGNVVENNTIAISTADPILFTLSCGHHLEKQPTSMQA